MRILLVLVMLSLSGCDKPKDNGRDAVQAVDASMKLDSSTCLSSKDRDRLMKEPVSNASARLLANHYGICASDGVGQERWLKVMAERGDAVAMTDLANLLRYQPGREAEAKHWMEMANTARPAK
jgi:hypothetical protein